MFKLPYILYLSFWYVMFFVSPAKIYSQEEKEEADTANVFTMPLYQLLTLDVYSVSKSEEKLSEVPMSVYQISKDELDRWGVRYLYETVGRTPGYTFYNTDYYGQYGVMARGWQSVWRYGYSINLMPIQDFGHTTFPSDFFGTIETARGPAGLAWGSGSNAGFMNLNIRNDLTGAEFVGQYGNYNYYSMSALYGGKIEKNKGSFFFGFNQKAQNFEVEEDAFNQPGNNWKKNGLLPSHSFVAQVEYGNFKGILYTERSDHYSPQLWFTDAYKRNDTTNKWEETIYSEMWQQIEDSSGTAPHDEMEVIAYRFEYLLPLDINNTKLSIYHNFYSKHWYIQPIASGGADTRDIGFSSNSSFLDKRLKLTVSGDIYGVSRSARHASNHRFALDRNINWFNTKYAPDSISFSNFFIQTHFKAKDNIKIIGGARLDYQNDGMYKDALLFSRAGIVYTINKNHTIKYIYNNAPRRPRANERRTENLKPEQLSAHELAVIGVKNEFFEYNITLFYQSLKNQITRNPSTFNDFTNTGGLQAAGIEWAFNYLPNDNTLLYWNGFAMSPKIIEGYTINQEGEKIPVSEAHNHKNQPLFVPSINTFIGAEYTFRKHITGNIAWRGIYGIPYKDQSNKNLKANTNFYDITLTSRKFWDKLEFSFVILNATNNQKKLPAYGEHAKNQPGTISPEGRRFYFKTRFSIPNKVKD